MDLITQIVSVDHVYFLHTYCNSCANCLLLVALQCSVLHGLGISRLRLALWILGNVATITIRYILIYSDKRLIWLSFGFSVKLNVAGFRLKLRTFMYYDA